MTKERALRLVRRDAQLSQSVSTEVAPESRVRSFVASNEAVDRYNTIIRASGWKLDNYQRNPVILFGHNGRELPIGKGTARIDGTSLMLDVEFLSAEENPLADQALRILDKGLMGVSVGFDPISFEYDESRETGDEWQDLFYPPLNYTATELLEVSVVTIPANPEALPVGRSVERRFFERALKRIAPKKDAREIPPDELRELIRPIVAAEVGAARAARARRHGTTTKRTQ